MPGTTALAAQHHRWPAMFQTPRERRIKFVRDLALRYAAAGLSVIPIGADGSKSPVRKWKRFQKRIASPNEINRMFSNGVGIAVVSGRVSGNKEMLTCWRSAVRPVFSEPKRYVPFWANWK